jgi:hypothetical protein
MSENWGQRRTFGPKRDEVTRDNSIMYSFILARYY